MRVFATAIIVGFALASSAFAGNIALTSLGATATCGGTIVLPNYPDICYLIYFYPAGTQYLPSNAIDGDLSTEWVAAGGTEAPYLLINLGGLYPVDSVTISGVGNPGNVIGFSVYVGTSSNVATLEAGTPIGTVASQMGGTPWNDAFSVAGNPLIQYVLYDVTLAYGNGSSGTTGLDDAYATEITVDDPNVPEPGTFGLIGTGLLALGFTRRSRKCAPKSRY